MIKYLLLLSILFSFGCTSQQKHKIPEQFKDLDNLIAYERETNAQNKITFKNDVVYGDSEEALIGKMGEVAVDSLGRVYIADVQNKSILAYDADGPFLAHFGREGKGPGEFGYILSLQIHHNHLYAFDSHQNRLNIFNLNTFSIEETIPLARNRNNYPDLKKAYPMIDYLHVEDSNNYIAKFKYDSARNNVLWENYILIETYYSIDQEGLISSQEIFNTQSTGTMVGVPSSKALLAYTLVDLFGAPHVNVGGGFIYVTDPVHFLIKIYESDGTYLRSFYYPLNKIPLTVESALEAKVPGLFIKNMKSMDLPEYWPAITDMKIDNQNRLWVATTIDDMTVYEWWILKDTGELITRFEWPRKKAIEFVSNDYIYTRETDVETEVDQIVRYRFKIEGGKF